MFCSLAPMYTPSMGCLSDDMVAEILTSLPFKCLSRFKCVSRAWHHLISEECRRRSMTITISGVVRSRGAAATAPRYGIISDGRLEDCNLSLFPFYQSSDLIDCCNGMLLFATWHPVMFHVCSPATGKWASLPKPPRRVLLSVLAFDPCRSPHYKVVCFTGWRDKGAELEVFTSHNGNWTEEEVYWGIANEAISTTMQYFNAALNILAYPQQMVQFDLTTMTSRLIKLPEPVKGEGCMGVSGGLLHYTSNISNNGEIKVWVMEDSNGCGSKWILKHCIKNAYRAYLKCLAFHPEVEVAYMQAAGKIVAYDMGMMKFDEFCKIGDEMEGANVVQIWMFSFTRFMSDCMMDGENF